MFFRGQTSWKCQKKKSEIQRKFKIFLKYDLLYQYHPFSIAQKMSHWDVFCVDRACYWFAIGVG